MRTSSRLVLICLAVLFASVEAAAAPKISVPASMSLGGQRVGVASTPHSLLVENTGDALLSITAISFSGTDSGDFAAVSMASIAMPIPVPPGTTKDIEFTFKPGIAGPRTGKLHLASNDPMTPTSETTLGGTGLVAAFEHTPMMLGFQKQRTGTCSAALFVKITNGGTDKLRVSGLRFEGMHATSFRTGSVPTSVLSGGFLFVDVSLCPRGIGMLSANLVITTDLKPDGSHKVTVPLSGMANGPLIEVTPSQIDFGAVYAGRPSAPVKVIIKNPGDDGTMLASVSISGADAGVFTAMLPGAGTVVPAGASVSFDISARLMDASPRAADLIIALHEELAPGKQIRIPLYATGVLTTLSISPLVPIDCGTQFVGVPKLCPTEIILRNTSERMVEGLMLASNLLDFTMEAVPQTLPPMQGVRVPITFRPALSGTRMATVSALALGLVGTHQVTVLGKGQAVAVNLSPGEVDFGSATVEPAAPVVRDLTVINRGTTPLSIELVVENQEGEASDEVTTDPPAFELMPDEPIGVTLTFSPKRVGEKLLTLYLRHAGQGSIIETVELRGVALNHVVSMEERGCALARGQAKEGTPWFLYMVLLITLSARIFRSPRKLC